MKQEFGDESAPVTKPEIREVAQSDSAQGSIQISNDFDIVRARAKARAIAQEIGFGLVDQTRIATAVSELARNVITHAVKGLVEITPVSSTGIASDGIEIVVRDDGPGIVDIKQAMRDGYSSGHGLGTGLGGTRRLMDEFEIESVAGKGTTVCVRKWL